MINDAQLPFPDHGGYRARKKKMKKEAKWKKRRLKPHPARPLQRQTGPLTVPTTPPSRPKKTVFPSLSPGTAVSTCCSVALPITTSAKPSKPSQLPSPTCLLSNANLLSYRSALDPLPFSVASFSSWERHDRHRDSFSSSHTENCALLQSHIQPRLDLKIGVLPSVV